MSPSLFRSKKGQVVDIFAGIQRSINWVLTTAPKPLLLLLFLLFLIAFSSIFSFLLNTTGNFCDTAGNEYRTGTFSLITNFQLITSMPSNEELNSEQLSTKEEWTESTLQECSSLYWGKKNNWTYVSSGTEYNLPRGYYFQDDGCIICNDSVTALSPEGTLFKTNICLDRIIYPKERDDMSFIEKIFCGKFLGRCDIPEGYYYDNSINKFICDDPLCKNEDNTTNSLGEIWNLKLREEGATINPPSEYGDRDYRNAINVECDPNDVKPNLRFFGVEVFDYKLWVMLMILSSLIWLVFKIKK